MDSVASPVAQSLHDHAQRRGESGDLETVSFRAPKPVLDRIALIVAWSKTQPSPLNRSQIFCAAIEAVVDALEEEIGMATLAQHIEPVPAPNAVPGPDDVEASGDGRPEDTPED